MPERDENVVFLAHLLSDCVVVVEELASRTTTVDANRWKAVELLFETAMAVKMHENNENDLPNYVRGGSFQDNEQEVFVMPGVMRNRNEDGIV